MCWKQSPALQHDLHANPGVKTAEPAQPPEEATGGLEPKESVVETSRYNRAAGFRRLGARKAARQVDHQVEAAACIKAADRLLLDLLAIVRKMHLQLDAGQQNLVAANKISRDAEYLPPATAHAELESVAS